MSLRRVGGGVAERHSSSPGGRQARFAVENLTDETMRELRIRRLRASASSAFAQSRI
jgi:hypothetical protein